MDEHARLSGGVALPLRTQTRRIKQSTRALSLELTGFSSCWQCRLTMTLKSVFPREDTSRREGYALKYTDLLELVVFSNCWQQNGNGPL